MRYKEELLEKLKFYTEQNLPLVIFAEPDSSLVQLYVQKNQSLHTTSNFDAEGFVLAPFKSEEKVLFLPFAEALHFEEILEVEKLVAERVQRDYAEAKHQEHLQLVSKGIAHIRKAKAEKIVLAREEKVGLSTWDPVLVFKRLLGLYPSAFRFMWFHPQVGWWCGATPETLVQVAGQSFYTMALAGTKPYLGEEPAWGQKERDEQQFVTDTILTQIKALCQDIQVSETYTQPAGQIAHLCTDIQGEMLEGVGIHSIARAVHPTPAICGTPTSEAKDFILLEEHFKRAYYAGFLGIIDPKKKSRLYVNLRSMSVKDKFASLYVGGGITKDSNPEEEWIETCNKTQTMLGVLKPLLA